MTELTGKDLIAYRTARFFKDGDLVNLGIGMPTLCLKYLPEDIDIWVDTENGAVGLTGAPAPGEDFDPNVVDAGGRPSKLRPGSACFDSFRSFGYIRGGHVDVTVLGAYEVDARGCLANWMIPGKAAAGMGGAMDLVTGSKTTIVMSTHTDKNGNPKLVHKTELPMTGWRCVDYFVSEMAVIHFIKDEFNIPRPFLEEISKKCSINDVLERTGANLIVSRGIKYIEDMV